MEKNQTSSFTPSSKELLLRITRSQWKEERSMAEDTMALVLALRINWRTSSRRRTGTGDGTSTKNWANT